MTTGPGHGAEAVIAAWRPRTVCPEAAAFARRVVAAAAPASPERAKALLFACSRLGAFGCAVGLDLIPEVMLCPSVIERFILAGTKTASGPTRRTLRTNLRHLARRVGPERAPAPLGLPRERAKAPYSDAEIAAYLGLADAQPTESRRMRAVGLVCLGAGAGLVGADLRAVRGTDIVARSGGMVVLVSGRRARVVPVRWWFQERLAVVANFCGTDLVVGGLEPTRRNVTTPLIASLAGGAELARLEVSRLRSSWLVACAEAIGLKALMSAAGLSCSQRLGDLVSHLGELSETEMVAILGGRR